MKRTIIGTLLLGLILSWVPANAETTCLCVGRENSKMCGNGAIGGSFLSVNSPAANLLRYYLLTTALQTQLSASGKAYDPNSGWFCWSGTLR